MRVLIVHRHFGLYGGAETVVIRLARLLKKKGIENSVIALSSPPPHVKETEDLDIITPEKEFTHKLRAITLGDCLESLNEINTLRKLVRRNMHQFDIVNVHNFPANWSIFPHHKPSVWLLNEPIGLWHNVNPSLSAKILNASALRLDRFVVNSSIDAICVAGAFNVSLRADGVLVNSIGVDSLLPEASTSVTFAWTPDTAGDYTLTATVDPENIIVEANETNNAVTASVNVTMVPWYMDWWPVIVGVIILALIIIILMLLKRRQLSSTTP